MAGGFDIDLSVFDTCKRIQSASFFRMGLNHHTIWRSVAKFLVDHKIRTVHFETCVGYETSEESHGRRTIPEIKTHPDDLCPEVTTLSIYDPYDEMSWMEGVHALFPNVSSLCVNPSLLSMTEKFPSLTNLTVTDASHDEDCKLFSLNSS